MFSAQRKPLLLLLLGCLPLPLAGQVLELEPIVITAEPDDLPLDKRWLTLEQIKELAMRPCPGNDRAGVVVATDTGSGELLLRREC